MGSSAVDIIWIVLSAALVFLMQGGFLCLESGLTRSKNNINVAIKNLTDFGVTTIMFWTFGYAFMFGKSWGGVIGIDQFFPDYGNDQERLMSFLLFQLMFCGASVTIMAGAMAERVRFGSYLTLAAFMGLFVYPIFGHWAWNGLNHDETTGFLESWGFVDFAGSTVVHSVGGWASIAVLLVIGPRYGRFNADGSVNKIQGSNIPMSVIGVILLWFGWFGFNGGSVLAVSGEAAEDIQAIDVIVRVLTNTVMAGSFGMVGTLLIGWQIRKSADIDLVINGSLGGLVGITASAFAVSLSEAAIIGLTSGIIVLFVDDLLLKLKIDDAVSAAPVHLGAGIWGTLCVGFFGDLDLLGTGLTRIEQIGVQLVGIVVCGIWVFGLMSIFARILNRISPVRVSLEDEQIGLNVSEHGAHTELLDLYNVMNQQQQTGNLALRVPVEPFTEVGQIAVRYNRVMDALEGAIAQTEGIIRNAMDAIITISHDTLSIKTLNPAAEIMFGWYAPELQGKSISNLLARDEVEMMDETHLRGLFRNAASANHHIEIMVEKATGESFPIEIAITEVMSGSESFYTAILRDVTERKEYEEELRNARDAAESANRSKSTFLANMSHELRTPLNAVIGYGDMLLSQIYGDINDKQRDRVSRMVQNGKLLLEHINSILDLSKIEAGRMEIYNELFALDKLLGAITNTVTPLMEKNKNQFEARIPPDLGMIYTDYSKLQQVLLNLISNAAKFTKEGRITLTAQPRHLDNRDWIEFRVADTGIGMTAEQMDHIFDEFSQADLSTTRQYGGTGLGLAISRRFTQMLGGEIHVASEEGVGSTFTVILPTDLHKVATPHGASDPLLEVVPANNVVLVIDDDPAVRELMTHYLLQEKFTVYTANDGAEGLEIARKVQPALITLDVMMPNMDGWRTLTALKSDPQLAKIPVVMITIVDDRNTGFALGASDFIAKPIDRRQLMEVLDKYRCADASCPVLVVDDDPEMRHVMRDILHGEAWTVIEAENGQEALAKLQETRPEVILLDLMMPIMDGFEFLEAMREMPAFRDIPVVVVTARHLDNEDMTRLQGGVKRILQKGQYSREDLLDELKQWVTRLNQGSE